MVGGNFEILIFFGILKICDFFSEFILARINDRSTSIVDVGSYYQQNVLEIRLVHYHLTMGRLVFTHFCALTHAYQSC